MTSQKQEFLQFYRPLYRCFSDILVTLLQRISAHNSEFYCLPAMPEKTPFLFFSINGSWFMARCDKRFLRRLADVYWLSSRHNHHYYRQRKGIEGSLQILFSSFLSSLFVNRVVVGGSCCGLLIMCNLHSPQKCVWDV